MSGHHAAAARGTRRIGARVLLVAIVIVLLTGAAFAGLVMRRRQPVRRAERPEPAASAEHIRVQVLNATTVRGLARRATEHLRDRGFDVVEIGTSRDLLDSTLVLDRSGHPDWARRVAEAMGGARVQAQPDTSRYLDVTVLIGRSWRAPAQPFYP